MTGSFLPRIYKQVHNLGSGRSDSENLIFILKINSDLPEPIKINFLSIGGRCS